MPRIGVTIAIIHDGRVLLTRREDFEIWCLPGGAVDDGETVAQAALREAREETGLTVELTRMVGIYYKPEWTRRGVHLTLFAARPVGGALRLDPREVIEAGFFDPRDLPAPLLWGHRQQILDAVSGAGGGLVWEHTGVPPLNQDVNQMELYALRDRSGLARRQFYVECLEPPAGDTLRLEVDGCRSVAALNEPIANPGDRA